MAGEAVKIISVLGKPATFDILRAIEKRKHRAYPSALHRVVQLSRGTILARLKELEEVGIVMRTPDFDASGQKPILKYSITKKGYDILRTIATLPTRGD